MNLRQYTIEVHRTQSQVVTFVVDMDAIGTDGDLTAVAVAHCKGDQWSKPGFERGNLTSEKVTT